MSVAMDAMLYADEDAARAAPEWRKWEQEQFCERNTVAAECARREQVWASRHPDEWEEWLRICPLLNPVIDFAASEVFGFDTFLSEVGRRPSTNYRVTQLDECRPFEQGNMAWRAKPVEHPSSPYLNAKQAAAYLGISLRTLYNNRRHIPSLPGFRTLMFDPKVLDEVRASMKFRTKRLTEQRKRRSRKAAA